MFSRFTFPSFVMALALLSLTACDMHSYVDDSASSDKNYVQLSPKAPPAPQAEVIPYNDDPRGHIWRPGYWSYNGSDFSWVPGEMIERPSFTAVWAPDHWVRHNFGWALVAGHWQ